uniref:Uncharacterized protein n=1 Tax=Arundo donax TaxID=35708 RepID=A0A0A9HM35_ARUDO
MVQSSSDRPFESQSFSCQRICQSIKSAQGSSHERCSYTTTTAAATKPFSSKQVGKAAPIPQRIAPTPCITYQ